MKNKYNWFQQKLHKMALGTQYMREVTFAAENILSKSLSDSEENVFIVGMARSGSTAIMNALFESEHFSSLSYAEMPFVLSPNLWSKIFSDSKNLVSVERAHGDGVKVTTKSPEAFEEVFWMTFGNLDDKSALVEKFRAYVALINNKFDKTRYLSKNNQNIRRIQLLQEIFPKSKILIPFRNPIQQSYSLLTQHRRFVEFNLQDSFVGEYMQLIGHTEFGPRYKPIANSEIKFSNPFDLNHWLEQWKIVYTDCLQKHSSQTNVKFVCYENLCSSLDYWLGILNFVAITPDFEYNFRASSKPVLGNVDQSLFEETSKIYSELKSL